MKLLKFIKKGNFTQEETREICESVKRRMMDLDFRSDNYQSNYGWQDEYDEWSYIADLADEILELIDENRNEEEIEDKGMELVDNINSFQLTCRWCGLSRWDL